MKSVKQLHIILSIYLIISFLLFFVAAYTPGEKAIPEFINLIFTFLLVDKANSKKKWAYVFITTFSVIAFVIMFLVMYHLFSETGMSIFLNPNILWSIFLSTLQFILAVILLFKKDIRSLFYNKTD
jgi:uncharacterized membrane protein